MIQFSHRITNFDRASLEREGLTIVGYLPDDALMVRGSIQQLAQSRSTLGEVRALTEWKAEWKLSPDLQAMKQASLVLIRGFEGTDAQRLASRLAEIEGVALFQMGGSSVSAHMAPEALLAAASLPEVEWMEPLTFFETMMMPADPSQRRAPPAYTGYETGTKLMGFDAAWARGYTGAGMSVGMADTGLDSGSISTIHKDFSTMTKGFAFGWGSDTWADDNGHGTHVAGSILGSGAASADGLLKGGAHGAKIVPQSIWSPFLNGILFGTDMNTMLSAAYNEGARVHSNSWGSAKNVYDTMSIDMDTFMWKNPDFLLVFAAGNGGVDANKDGVIDPGSVGTPGTAKNVLTVGASENYLLEGGQLKTHYQWHPESWPVEPIASDKVSNNPDGLAAFSSRGPTSDGRIKPEIVAPGTNIVSARSHRPKAGLLWGEYDAEHSYCGGTSMATPLTSGAATVTREFLIRGRGIANPSAAVVKATMLHTAHDLFPGQYGLGATQEIPVRRPNIQEGYGRVDVDAATALGLESLVIDERSGVATGETYAQEVAVNEGGSLRATLSYTDAPGVASAAIALVNDVDLEIVTPSGEVRSLKDRRNNSEMLELSALAGGTYTVRVAGVNVPQGKSGKQPFALLVTAQ